MKDLKDWVTFRPWERHSLVLVMAGFYYIATGILYFGLIPLGPRERALRAAAEVMPLDYWGFVFIFVGILSILSSVWPAINEKWGYVLLTGFSAGWAAVYLVGILFYGTGSVNYSYVWIWLFHAFTWWAISGLMNPDRRAVERYGRRRN